MRIVSHIRVPSFCICDWAYNDHAELSSVMKKQIQVLFETYRYPCDIVFLNLNFVFFIVAVFMLITSTKFHSRAKYDFGVYFCLSGVIITGLYFAILASVLINLLDIFHSIRKRFFCSYKFWFCDFLLWISMKLHVLKVLSEETKF